MNNVDLKEIEKSFDGKFVSNLMVIAKDINKNELKMVLKLVEGISLYNESFINKEVSETDNDLNFTIDDLISDNSLESFIILIQGLDYNICVKSNDEDGYEKLLGVSEFFDSMEVKGFKDDELVLKH